MDTSRRARDAVVRARRPHVGGKAPRDFSAAEVGGGRVSRRFGARSAEQPADVLRGEAAGEQVAVVHDPAEKRGLAAREGDDLLLDRAARVGRLWFGRALSSKRAGGNKRCSRHSLFHMAARHALRCGLSEGDVERCSHDRQCSSQVAGAAVGY